MARRIALGSLAAVAIVALSGAWVQQDPWEKEKKDPKFADVDWDFGRFDTPVDPGMAAGGAQLYDRLCVSCHGAKGDGTGILSDLLIPRPRDFTRGIFKGRSSHPDLPPTATDLMRSLIHGIPLSAMLSYSFIDTAAQQALIAHIRFTLAAAQFPKGFGFPLKSGNFHRGAQMPLPTAETIARGRALFDRFSCIACHGEKGDGKGRVVGTLSDSADGRPSNVRDFTQGIYSGGPNTRHMYLRISGGVQGTVMPPFATSASVEDRWALAHYVMSLSNRAKPLPLPHSELMIAAKAEGKLPATPEDPAWAALEKKDPLPMQPGPFGYPIQPFWVQHLFFQQMRHNASRPYFTEATARALHDGKNIAVRLEWEDAGSDPGDRIEFQISGIRPPDFAAFAIYGSPTDPVSLWRWEASAPQASVELDGTGPFTVAPRAASNVTVNAVYKAATKRWAVVFTRSLAGGGGKDPAIIPGALNPFLVLMKDGSETWPAGRRPIVADPDADPAETAKAKADEAARQADEKAIEAKFKDLPRHVTTWHFLQLE